MTAVHARYARNGFGRFVERFMGPSNSVKLDLK